MLTLFVSLFAIAFSQPPPGGGSGGSSGGDSGSSSSSTCDMYGGSASYSESVDSGASTRTLTSSGCPNHYSICTGKDFGVCGAAGEEGTDSEASGSDGSKVINIPLYPKLQPNGASTDLEYTLGEIATALNGVSIFGGAVSQTELLEVDNCMSEWSSFDCCGGHAENSGDYHYHFAPPCLMDQAGTMENGHSNQVGWSWDGFPIYGIYSVGGVQVQNCGTEGADATYCQDECGGIEFTDSSVDEYTYRYYFTGEQGDLGTLPMYPRPGGDDAASAFDKFYPYTIKCYRGYRESEDDSAGVDGTTANFVAQPVDGYSDAHPTTCTTTTWECTDGVTTYTNPGTSVQTDETTTTTTTTSASTTSSSDTESTESSDTESTASTASTTASPNNDSSVGALSLMASVVGLFVLAF